MTDIILDIDGPLLVPAMLAWQEMAQALLIEFAKSHPKADFVKLKQRLIYQAATLEAPDDADPEVAEKWSSVAVAAIEHVFDSVAFEPKGDRTRSGN